jgi:hypothetical protein
MQQRIPAVPQTALTALTLALTCGGAAAAGADEGMGPWYIGVSQAFSRDSNIFRRPDDSSQGPVYHEYISKTGVLGGLNIPFGRQRFFVDATVQHNGYHNFDQLDNTSYNLTTGLDWQTIEHLSGTLRYIDTQSLANYGAVDAPVTTAKDTERIRQTLATVRYGLERGLALDASAAHRAADYSLPQDLRGFSQNSGSVGLHWSPTGILTLGAALRKSKTDYDAVVLSTGGVGPDKLDRNDVDLTATWVPTGLSQFDARLSSTREKHSAEGRPDFSGITGMVGWTWKPSGKLTLKTSVTRDTGTETTFIELPGLLPTRVDNARINTVYLLDTTWEATSKIALTGSARHDNASYASGSDVSTSLYALGARYLPTRSLTFSCNLSHETRSNSYHDNIMTCLAQFVLR